MAYQCSVCGSKVADDLLVYVRHTETHIIESIKANHPEWVENEGICEKCMEYLRRELKGETKAGFWTKEQCAARRQTIKTFFNHFINKFTSKNPGR